MPNNSCILNTESGIITNPGVHRTLPQFKKRLTAAVRSNKHTPDIAKLESKRGHLLFIYGTLKRGGVRNWMMRGYKARFIANAITFNHYSLLYNPQGKYPVMIPPNPLTDSGNIVGELYIVPTKVIKVLDDVESNLVMYHRLQLKTQLTTKPTDSNFQQFATTYAYAYMGDVGVWGPMLEADKMLGLKNTRSDGFIEWVDTRLITP